tara:strand:+ start:502 stop:903 length:402 start_codon:yes stop_codon:yes gene_type:complete
LSSHEQNWWIFLDAWSSAIKNKNFDQFDVNKLITDLDLDINLVHEFINYFRDDFSFTKNIIISICMGASCRSKGNEQVFSRLEDANKSRIPERQLQVKPVLCLSECNQAPCSMNGPKLQTGDDLSWVDRIVKE